MEEGKNRKTAKNEPLAASFKTGALALVFLLIGYETALFIHRAAELKLAANRDKPDTVYVYAGDTLALSRMTAGEWSGGLSKGDVLGRSARTPEAHLSSRGRRPMGSHGAARRTVESFRFNPNTVSLEDLQRLGFSEKQALAIVHYREAGGRFRRPSDFAKSYVVEDSVFRRLEPWIVIPKIDINRADSAAFETLPGIGPWFAARMVSYRKALRGYSCPEQLMEIYRFDAEKYAGLQDLISCSKPQPFPIWTFPADSLETHPHISRREADAIVLYRTYQPQEQWTLQGLIKAGILSEEHAAGLSRCLLATP